jgi:hypothetical protein
VMIGQLLDEWSALYWLSLAVYSFASSGL